MGLVSATPPVMRGMGGWLVVPMRVLKNEASGHGRELAFTGGGTVVWR